MNTLTNNISDSKHNTIIENQCQSFSLNFENIPDELKQLDQWVNYKMLWVEEKQKFTKPPVDENGYNKKDWNTEENLMSFKNAVKNYNNCSVIAGIGFAPNGAKINGKKITIFDIDHCITSKDNIVGVDDELTPEAKHILNAFDSYAEVSPSDDGLHIVGLSDIPDGHRHKTIDNYELFSDSGYVTMTGRIVNETLGSDFINKLSDRKKLKDCTRQTDIFYKTFVPEKPENSSATTEKEIPKIPFNKSELTESDKIILNNAFLNFEGGKRAKEIYETGVVFENKTHSELDLKLCNFLSFVFKDNTKSLRASKIDAAFRESKCFRNKWDEKHFKDGTTYGQNTIYIAIRDCDSKKINDKNEPDKLEEINFITVEEIIKRNRRIEYIAKGFFAKKKSLGIVAKGGTGKSMLSLYLACFFGSKKTESTMLFDKFKCTKQYVTLMLQVEDDETTINQRTQKMIEEINPDGNVLFQKYNDDVKAKVVPFLDNANNSDIFKNYFDNLIYTIEEKSGKKIDIIIIDPMISFLNCDENKNAEVRRNLDILDMCCTKHSITPIVIHHAGKGGLDPRGASSIRDFFRDIYTMDDYVIDNIDGKEEKAIIMNHFKSNSQAKNANFNIKMNRNFIFKNLEQQIDFQKKQDFEAVIKALEDMDGKAESQNALAKMISEGNPNISKSKAKTLIAEAVKYHYIFSKPFKNTYKYSLGDFIFEVPDNTEDLGDIEVKTKIMSQLVKK